MRKGQRKSTRPTTARDQAPPVAEATGRDTSILFYSDLHFPYHDTTCVERLYDHLKSETFDHVIDGGDSIDAYSVSKYEKDPRRIAGLQDEIDEYQAHNKIIDSLVHGASQHWLRGNHDERLPNYTRNRAPALESLRNLNLTTVLGIDHWNTHDRRGVTIGGVRFKHGDKVATGSGNSVRKEMNDLWQSVVMGHCHRQAVVNVRKGDREFVGVEAGTMSNLNPEYMTEPDWKNGWVVVRIADCGSVSVEEHNP